MTGVRSIAIFQTAFLVMTAVTQAVGQQSADQSAHRAALITHDAVHLHYLEWRTTGPTVVLVPGYSLTAHAFDDIAALLPQQFHVIAVTPRGFGESDAPTTGEYTVAVLVEDLHAILDSLHIQKAALVGHSLAGTVIASFALRYPARVSRLLFLDSFPYFSEEHGDSIARLDPISTPPFTGDTTYDAAARYLATYRFVPWQPALDADLRAKPLGDEGARRRALTASYISDQWAHPPALSELRVPTLQICAKASVKSEYPWLNPSDPTYNAAKRFIGTTLGPFNRKLCRRFESTVPGAQVARIRGSHYVFFTNPKETARILTEFMRAEIPH